MTGEIYCGDALDWLRGLPDDWADLVFADPPYNAGKDYGLHDDSMPWAEYWSWIAPIIHEAERVARRGTAWLLPHYLIRGYWNLLPEAEQIIVRKHTQGIIQEGWQRQYLAVLTTARPTVSRLAGARCMNLLDKVTLPGDGYFFKEERPDHPAFTCQALVSWALDLLTLPGELVLDPFMGSGTVAVVAEKHGRRWAGADLSETYVRLATERINRERWQLPLGLSECGARHDTSNREP